MFLVVIYGVGYGSRQSTFSVPSVTAVLSLVLSSRQKNTELP